MLLHFKQIYWQGLTFTTMLNTTDSDSIRLDSNAHIVQELEAITCILIAGVHGCKRD